MPVRITRESKEEKNWVSYGKSLVFFMSLCLFIFFGLSLLLELFYFSIFSSFGGKGRGCVCLLACVRVGVCASFFTFICTWFLRAKCCNLSLFIDINDIMYTSSRLISRDNDNNMQAMKKRRKENPWLPSICEHKNAKWKTRYCWEAA